MDRYSKTGILVLVFLAIWLSCDFYLPEVQAGSGMPSVGIAIELAKEVQACLELPDPDPDPDPDPPIDPTASFSYDGQPCTGSSFRFDGSGSIDPDGNIDTYKWEVDSDEQPGGSAIFNYTFTSAGSHTVRLTVTDDGIPPATDWVEHTVYVGDPALDICYVDATEGDNGNAGTEGSPFATIQYAIDRVCDEATVYVIPGSYFGTGNYNVSFRYKDITVANAALHNNEHQGNYSGDVTVDCDYSGRGFSIVQSDGTLEGITIINGLLSNGGGIYIHGRYPTVKDCTINNCQTSTTYGSGGIKVSTGHPTFINCRIQGNTQTGGGTAAGGVYLAGGSTSEFINCLITDNTSNSIAGGVFKEMGSNATFTHCTIAKNIAGTYGGGLYSRASGTTELENSIVWGNQAGTGVGDNDGDEIYAQTNAVSVSYSDVRGGLDGAYVGGSAILGDRQTVIGFDPDFAGVDDFHIAGNSPCVDKCPEKTPDITHDDYDLDGNARPMDITGVGNDSPSPDIYDMGCYEVLTSGDTDPPTPDPATFASAPSADSDSAISMTATTGTDASGPVEYFFIETSGNPGGTSSTIWQTSPSYTDSGLDPSTEYTYTVQMRDSSPAQNTGTESTPANATTDADTDADDDGMPDSWENVYGLDATDPNDADDDEDQDGLTNLQEFQYETNPRVFDTDGDGVDDGWEVGYSANFYQAGVQEALDPTTHDAHEKVVGGIPAIWWYTWWTYCTESADSTIQDMYFHFEPSTDNASEDTNLDDDGFTNLTEYQNGTNPVEEDNSSDYWTEYIYDDTNNLKKQKQWVYDRVTQVEVCIAETVDYYDDLGRPWRTRQKSNPNGSIDNAEDAITLIKYYVDDSDAKTIRKGYAVNGNANTNDAAEETGDIVVAITYDALGHQYQVTDAGGDVTTYNYSTTTGLLESVTLPAKSGDTRSTSYIYDEVGRVTATINPEGNYEAKTYDSMGRVIKSMIYETVGSPDVSSAETNDIPVAQHRMEYDNLGTLVKDVVMADASSTEPNDVSTDRVTELDIDYSDIDKTQLASIFSDVGKVTASQWSESDVNRDATGKGLPTLIRSGYSEDDRQPTTDQQIVYNASGRVIAKTIAHFASRDAEDPTHSYMTKMVYDGYGRLVASISDPDSDPNTTTGDLRSEFVYWGNRKIEQIDPEGNKITFEYNAFGQLKTKTEDADGLARVTESEYDRLGNLKKITADDDNNSGNGVQNTQYTYDAAGHVTQITYPDTGTITYVYDDPAAGGIPTKRIDQRNRTTVYEYDKLGKLLKKQNAITSPTIVERYTYDARGLMLTAKKGTVADDDATSASVFNYNGLGHLDYNTQSIKGTDAREVDYDHNQIGKPTKITYPDTSETEIAYSYTSLVMIDKIHRDPDGTPVLLVDYDYAGSMITGRVYTQASVDFTPLYDNYGRVERHTTENSSDVGTDFEYTYDDNSNITDKIFHHRASSPYNDYGYDDLNRLTTSDYLVGDASNWDEAFDYDLLGNRDEWFKDGTSQGTYTHDSTNAYTSVLSNTVSHDDSGNLTADHRGYSYEYDYENRLTKIKKSSGTVTVAEFVYDALGRRIEKLDAIGSETTRFYYDDQRVLLEADWSGSAETDERYFVYGNYIDEVLVMKDIGGSDHYYGHDHLFSAVIVFDDTGTVEERYEYDAYGKCSVLEANLDVDGDGLSDIANPYLFTGRRLDTMDSGSLAIYYYRARYYDPETGRFLQRDPLGINPAGGKENPFSIAGQYTDGMNLYQYVRSNPMSYSDPYGLYPWGEHWDHTKCAKYCFKKAALTFIPDWKDELLDEFLKTIKGKLGSLKLAAKFGTCLENCNREELAQPCAFYIGGDEDPWPKSNTGLLLIGWCVFLIYVNLYRRKKRKLGT